MGWKGNATMTKDGERRAGGDRPSSRAETAAYLEALAEDMVRLARRSGLPTLAYLLDMARIEARTHAGRDAETSAGSAPGLGDA